MPAPVQRLSRLAVRGGETSEGVRAVPEETALSLVYDGGSYAVMMGSPTDLDDFAVGFSLSEGIIDTPDDVEDFETIEYEAGIELRLWLKEPHAKALAKRRRMIAGPTGCGLCGIDSLAEALRPARLVTRDTRFCVADIESAMAALAPAQALNRETRAVHAAAFWSRRAGLVALREDVGRHNALDKLAGALARAGVDAGDGLVALTSRVSVEMVQKTAAIGAPLIVAVSAPTALAVRTAEAAGITLVGIARSDGFEIFTHPGRIGGETPSVEPLHHVA